MSGHRLHTGPRRAPRGVALVQALIVVAALAAIAAALMAQARRGTEGLALRAEGAQAAAWLDAGTAQAAAELAVLLDGRSLRPGAGWDAPRAAPIGTGQVGWRAQDLQGRFNLAWLGAEDEAGAQAAADFVRMARAQGLPAGLAERLARAAGPDAVARAAAFGTAAPPDLPLLTPRQLALIPTPAEGGPEALAPLLPLLAALPAQATFNPLTAPLPVLQALIPGLSPRDWAEYDAARAAGVLDSAEALLAWAAQHWPPAAQDAAARLPLGGAATWLALDLEVALDGQARRRSVVLAARPGPTGAPILQPVLSLPE
jgi:general secretion pathway protein K